MTGFDPVAGCDPAARVVAVDLGGTKTSAALVSRTGEVGPVATVPTPAARGPEAILDAVAEAVARVRGDRAVPAIGIGTAGVVDGNGRVVSATDILPGWVGTEVAAGVAARTGVSRVHVQNDVNAHAAGEAWRGAGRGQPCMLMVAVGTGVGGAIVLDGVARRGAHHVSGEIGHHPTPGAEGLVCGCGREGHLDAIAPGPMILRRYLALGGAPADDARAVFARASDGDGLAARVVTDAAEAVGRAVAGQVTVLDPDVVVIGGGVPQAGELWWRPMEARLRAELVDVLAGLPVVPAELGQAAALVGAAYAAWRMIEQTPEPNRD